MNKKTKIIILLITMVIMLIGFGLIIGATQIPYTKEQKDLIAMGVGFDYGQLILIYGRELADKIENAMNISASIICMYVLGGIAFVLALCVFIGVSIIPIYKTEEG